MKKELNPIANRIPYVLKSFGYYDVNAGLKAFAISRCKGIPQISCHPDALVMTVLLIQAHASACLDGCKAITTRLLTKAGKQLALDFYVDLTEHQ